MLQILQFFLVFMVLTPSNTIGVGEGEIFEIRITRQTTLKELKQIQQKLKEKGIELEITEYQYLSPNHLKSIRIRVDFGEGKPQTYGARNFSQFWIIKDSREGERPRLYIGRKPS